MGKYLLVKAREAKTETGLQPPPRSTPSSTPQSSHWTQSQITDDTWVDSSGKLHYGTMPTTVSADTYWSILDMTKDLLDPTNLLKNSSLPTLKFNDFVMRPGQAPVSFSGGDTLVGMKNMAGMKPSVTIGSINISGFSGDTNELVDKLTTAIKRELNTL